MFNMMRAIARQMDNETGAYALGSDEPKVLDLCMAPGGFVAYFLERFPDGRADAITLPVKEGGHQVVLPFGSRNDHVHVTFADVTIFATELGVQGIPEEHPDKQKLLALWPYSQQSYDLVICDGQALRTQNLAEYRKTCEQSRLFNSQLVLALKKVRPGGTIIALLYKSHKWRTFSLLQMFSKFSDIQLFKPKRFYAKKSSFYLVAKNVRPESQDAIDAVGKFARSWARGTLLDATGPSEENDNGDSSDGEMKLLLEDFGDKFIYLAKPVWEVQATALANARWMSDDSACVKGFSPVGGGAKGASAKLEGGTKS
jgi:23S rRNA U2552 (ribose-2'-O)-methylase RlmE/FtsJ